MHTHSRFLMQGGERVDEYLSQKRLLQKIQKKFYGHDVLYSKYVPQIPQSADREYKRIVKAYMRLLKSELETTLPLLKDVYKKNMDEMVAENRRADGFADILMAVNTIFDQIKNNITKKKEEYGLVAKLTALSKLTHKLSVKEWKKAVKRTLGIDIREDYYNGDKIADLLEEWVSRNVELISTIPDDTLDKMKDIVYDGYVNGKSTTRMVEDIQRIYMVSQRHAELIARDQTAKLNGAIQRQEQQDAGITEYIWCTTGDERVRRSHAELNGKKFSWASPPITDGGRMCHPGEDFQCRCIGRPVFNKNLNLPIDDSVEIRIK